MRTDQVTAALREASAGGGDAPSSTSDLETALAAAAEAAPRPPAMPETRAVLRQLPAHGTFPGAEYRLAGDRCAGRADEGITPSCTSASCTGVRHNPWPARTA